MHSHISFFVDGFCATKKALWRSTRQIFCWIEKCVIQ